MVSAASRGIRKVLDDGLPEMPVWSEVQRKAIHEWEKTRTKLASPVSRHVRTDGCITVLEVHVQVHRKKNEYPSTSSDSVEGTSKENVVSSFQTGYEESHVEASDPLGIEVPRLLNLAGNTVSKKPQRLRERWRPNRLMGERRGYPINCRSHVLTLRRLSPWSRSELCMSRGQEHKQVPAQKEHLKTTGRQERIHPRFHSLKKSDEKAPTLRKEFIGSNILNLSSEPVTPPEKRGSPTGQKPRKKAPLGKRSKGKKKGGRKAYWKTTTSSKKTLQSTRSTGSSNE